MNINKILELIETYLPRLTAMEGDKLGLQIQSGRNDINKLLVTMELNEGVVDEAVTKGNDCIITFHPLIFNPIFSITDNDRVGKIIDKLISSRISLISIHTNFDSYCEGTSFLLARKLDFEVSGFLVPNQDFLGYGMGVICDLKKSITLDELLDKIQSVCSSPIRYCSGLNDSELKRIAIVGGSGSSFIDNALNAKADALITADISYHNFHRVSGRMAVIDPGHYEMEQFVAAGIRQFLLDKIDNNIDVSISETYTNPVSYYPDAGFREKQINNL